MSELHIITPVKNSIPTTLETIRTVTEAMQNTGAHYTIYNDFSTDEATAELKTASEKYGFELFNLADITNHPSPNYLLVLQLAQQKAKAQNAHLLIIESDVEVSANTVHKLIEQTKLLKKPGLIAAVTVDNQGLINFPYLYARKYKPAVHVTKKRLSFCCTVLTSDFLHAYDFTELNPEKSWYDIFISHKSVELGFSNYLLTNMPVLHKPHSSRPWKLLKYTNPLKYYFRKYFVKNNDKI